MQKQLDIARAATLHVPNPAVTIPPYQMFVTLPAPAAPASQPEVTTPPAAQSSHFSAF